MQFSELCVYLESPAGIWAGRGVAFAQYLADRHVKYRIATEKSFTFVESRENFATILCGYNFIFLDKLKSIIERELL